MENEEIRLLDQRSQASRAAIRRTTLTFSIATVLALGLLGAVLWLALSDLAHRQQASEELRRSEAWLSTTLESIGDAIIATDAKGRIRLLNPIARRLTGWTQEEAKDRPLEEVFVIINEERRTKVESPVGRVLREGCVVGLANHTILIAKDGSEQPIDDSGAPIRGDDGSISGVVLCFRDVTERTRADREKARLAALVESSEDAIIGTGLDGTILSWNRGAARTFGYAAEEVVGGPVATLFRPYRPEEISGLFEALRAASASFKPRPSGGAQTAGGSTSPWPSLRSRTPRGAPSAFRSSPVMSPSAAALRKNSVRPRRRPRRPTGPRISSSPCSATSCVPP